MQNNPVVVGCWAGLVSGVRAAMILDVIHEFLVNEVPDTSNIIYAVWHDAVERNQEHLERLFETINTLNATTAAESVGEQAEGT